jgi:hypothetical protein
MRQRVPFPLLGIHSDCGGEFINEPLSACCQLERIGLTRSRSGNKNDNCHIEQKNLSVAGQAVGYARYETVEQLALLNRLYRELRLYTNYSQPMFKLLEQTRTGSRIHEHYDVAKTPYQRPCDWSGWAESDRERAQAQYQRLNPAARRDLHEATGGASHIDPCVWQPGSRASASSAGVRAPSA